MVKTRAAAAAAKQKISRAAETTKKQTNSGRAKQTSTSSKNTKRPLQEKEEPPTKRVRVTKSTKTDFVTKNKQNVTKNSKKLTRSDSTAKSLVHTPRQQTRKPRPTPNSENEQPKQQNKATNPPTTLAEAPQSFQQLESQWKVIQFDNEVTKKCLAMEQQKRKISLRIATDQALCLSQIPKSIRKMPLEELKNNYGGDINKALSSLMSRELSALENSHPSDLDSILKIAPEDLLELEEEKQSSYRAHLQLLLQTLE